MRELGYKVTEIDVQPDIGEALAREKPDIVFNALHGRFGEDGIMQGILEMLRIPYTHSGVLASALAMRKDRAKELFRATGVENGTRINLGRNFQGHPSGNVGLNQSSNDTHFWALSGKY